MVAEYDGLMRCGFVKSNGLSDLEYDSYKTVKVEENPSYSNDFFGDEDDHVEHKEKLVCLIVTQNEKKGVVGIDNHVIVPIENQEVEQFDLYRNPTVLFKVKKGDYFGVYSMDGRLVLPIIYHKIRLGWGFPDIQYFEAETDTGEELVFDLNGGTFTPQRRSYSSERPKTPSAPVSVDDERPRITSRAPVSISGTHKSEYYLFFDTETTGLPRNYKAPSSDTNNWPRMVQLSWVLTDQNGHYIRGADYIIKPSGFTIPQDASRLHGITTTRAINEGEEIRNVLSAFKMDLKKATKIVGHNIDFDKKIVGAELIRLGERDIVDSLPTICTMKAGTDYCAIPGNYGYKYPTLQELHKALFGVGFEDAHNSSSDVAATEKCFWKMKEKGLI